jgi:phosphatidylglycerophosphate synthase
MLTSGVAIAFLLLDSPLTAAGFLFVGLQLAYGLDCADGQVARATRTTSAGGAKLDLICDFLVQVSVLCVMGIAVSGEFDHELRGLVLAAVAGGWLVPVVTGALSLESLGSSWSEHQRPWWYRLLGGLRDYGFHIGLVSIALVSGAGFVLAVAMTVAALHYLFLAKVILTLCSATASAEADTRPVSDVRQAG